MILYQSTQESLTRVDVLLIKVYYVKRLILVCLVEFSMVVFKPSIGEVIKGKISKMSLEGIYGERHFKMNGKSPQIIINILVSLGFFSDICIPSSSLDGESFVFDGDGEQWCFQEDKTNPEEEEEEEDEECSYLGIGDPIRCIIP